MNDEYMNGDIVDDLDWLHENAPSYSQQSDLSLISELYNCTRYNGDVWQTDRQTDRQTTGYRKQSVWPSDVRVVSKRLNISHHIINTHGSPWTLVFWSQRSWWNSSGVTPKGCSKYSCGIGKLTIDFQPISRYMSTRYKIDTRKANRKSYVFYWTVPFSSDLQGPTTTTPSQSTPFCIFRVIFFYLCNE